MTTLTDLFCTFAPRGAAAAFIYRTGVRRRAYSYAWLADTSLRMASWLAVQGVGPGDRVLLWCPNSPWWGAAFWGIVARGAVAVPVDFMAGRDRAETIAALTQARLVIQSRQKPERLPEGKGAFLEDLEFLLPDVPPAPAPHRSAPADVAQLIYTSGTTGNPKGVILTHANLMANLEQVHLHIPVVTSDYTFLSLLPLSHMFEQMGGFFTPLARGGSIVYLRTLKPAAIMEGLGEEEIAAVIAVPRLLQLLRGSIERELEARGLAPLFDRLLKLAEGLSPAARRRLFYPIRRKFGKKFALFVSGGAPLDQDLFRFWSLLGFTVLEGYGLSECSPVLTANPVERQVPGAVGKPLPGVELRIADGEVLARGANVFSGYFENETATREAFTADGWFRTGDLGHLDGDGFLHIRGRLKELIVTGAGVNVYPDEIEAVLRTVAGVREGCVIGLDRGTGEEVHAVLITDGSGRGVEEIVREANDRLDPLQQITGFSIWPDDDFPKTTTLKVRKFQVRERIRSGLPAGGGEGGDRLARIIARVTGLPAEAVREESFLVSDLGLTSIARLELVSILEQEFRLDIDDSLIGLRTTVRELRGMVERRDRLRGQARFRFWATAPVVRRIRQCADLLLNYPLFRLLVTLEVRGGEHLEALREPCLFIANHTSYLDQPAIMFSLPRPVRYRTATATWAEFFFKNFRNPLQRLWKRITFEYGTFCLNLFPLSQESGFRSALAFMGRLVDQGENILVFPEGERSRDGSLLPFQPGLGIMARELGTPVVPVRIDGLTRVLPRGASWPRRGKVTVTFGEPLTFTRESVEEIVGRARQAIEALGCGPGEGC
jgi:long-chain acyl-CoA synthetase